MNWGRHFTTHIDPNHAQEWSELFTVKDTGIILRSVQDDYVSVSLAIMRID